MFNQWNAVDTAVTAICLSVFPSVCPFTCVHGSHVMTVRYRDVILAAVGRRGLESECVIGAQGFKTGNCLLKPGFCVLETLNLGFGLRVCFALQNIQKSVDV